MGAMGGNYFELDLDYALKIHESEMSVAADSLLAWQLQEEYDQEHQQFLLGSRRMWETLPPVDHYEYGNHDLITYQLQRSSEPLDRNLFGNAVHDELNYEELLELQDALGDIHSHGLKSHEIQTLPTTTFRESNWLSICGKHEISENICQICLSEYREGEKLRILPCLHRFHATCIDQWIKSKGQCPVCRIMVKDQLSSKH